MAARPDRLPYAPDAVLDVACALGSPCADRADAGELVACALEAGRRGRAAALGLAGLGRAPSELLAERGVEVVSRDRCGCDAAGVWVSALTVRDGARCHVELFESELAEKGRALRRAGVEIEDAALVELHLAHELYHVLEAVGEVPDPSTLPRVPLCGAFGLRRGRVPAQAGEASAHAFAHALVPAVPHPVLADLVVARELGRGPADEPDRTLGRAWNTYEAGLVPAVG